MTAKEYIVFIENKIIAYDKALQKADEDNKTLKADNRRLTSENAKVRDELIKTRFKMRKEDNK